MNKPRIVNVPFEINADAVKEIDIASLQKSIQYLVSLFKEDYERLFKVQINSTNEALKLMHTANALEKLETAEGFDKHINEYKNDVESTYFVSVLADYLDRKASYIGLEPDIEGHSKAPDIRIMFDKTAFYIECKNPKKDILKGLKEEQATMFNALFQVAYENSCNLTIAYKEPLSDDELAELNDFLKKRLKHVTGEGTILLTDDIEVSVTNFGNRNDDIGEQYFQFIVENRYSERNLICLFTRNGTPIAFVKNSISVIDNIESQLKKCKNKVPDSSPLVLAIQSEYLIGHSHKNMKMISNLFKPNKFTSINGILLTNWSYGIKNIINHEFIYINNPYAKNPIIDFERLFRKESDGVVYEK
jgi:hypothetical protein